MVQWSVQKGGDLGKMRSFEAEARTWYDTMENCGVGRREREKAPKNLDEKAEVVQVLILCTFSSGVGDISS